MLTAYALCRAFCGSWVDVDTSDVSSRQRLRLANRHQLIFPRHRRSMFGRRAFFVAGPMEWNSLPDSFRDPARCTDSFRSALKTHLFTTQRNKSSNTGSALDAPRDTLYKYTTITTIITTTTTDTSSGDRKRCDFYLRWSICRRREEAATLDHGRRQRRHVATDAEARCIQLPTQPQQPSANPCSPEHNDSWTAINQRLNWWRLLTGLYHSSDRN